MRKIPKVPTRLPKLLPRNPAALPAKMRRASKMTNRNEKRAKEPEKFGADGWQQFQPDGPHIPEEGIDLDGDCPFCFEEKLNIKCGNCQLDVCSGCEKYCCNCYDFVVNKEEE